MENQELMVDEHRRLELDAARRDVTGACDCCGGQRGKAWMDGQWLCDDCLAFFGHKLDEEGQLVPVAQSRGKRRGIGGSDIPPILGMDEFNDAFGVAMRLRGELEPEPPNERMLAGKFLERGIADMYTWKTGRRHKWCDDTRRYPAFPQFMWTPDALCIDEPIGIDCKLVAWDQKHLWGPSAQQIPARVRLQIEWYMKLSGLPRWDVAAFIGDRLEIFEFEEDPELGDALLRIAGAFWRRCVIGGEIPMIGTSPASERWLRQHHPRNKEELRRATSDEESLLELYSDIRTEHEQAERARCQLENQLKQAVGDCDGIYDRYRKFTWKCSKERIVCDWEAVARHLMENLPESTRTVLIAEHSKKEAGSRRMHWHEKKDAL